MFDKEKFSIILQKINSNYYNMSEFAKNLNSDRSYISKYIHQKLDNPPTPKVLMGIAEASKGVTNYYELMEICGYLTSTETEKITNSLSSPTGFFTVPVYISKDSKLVETDEDVALPFSWDRKNSYFGYKTCTDDMLPLLGNGDIAIIEKSDIYENGETCLLSLDKDIMIRKIIEFNDYIELQTAFPYSPVIKLPKEDMEKRNFKVLGKVIKAENQSAFK